MCASGQNLVDGRSSRSDAMCEATRIARAADPRGAPTNAPVESLNALSGSTQLPTDAGATNGAPRTRERHDRVSKCQQTPRPTAGRPVTAMWPRPTMAVEAGAVSGWLRERGTWIRMAGVLLILGGVLWSLALLLLGLIFIGLGEDPTPSGVVAFMAATAGAVGGGIVAGIGVLRRWRGVRVVGIAFAGAICALRVGYVVSGLDRSGDVLGLLWKNAALIAPAVAVVVILLATWSEYHEPTATSPGAPAATAPTLLTRSGHL